MLDQEESQYNLSSGESLDINEKIKHLFEYNENCEFDFGKTFRNILNHAFLESFDHIFNSNLNRFLTCYRNTLDEYSFRKISLFIENLKPTLMNKIKNTICFMLNKDFFNHLSDQFYHSMRVKRISFESNRFYSIIQTFMCSIISTVTHQVLSQILAEIQYLLFNLNNSNTNRTQKSVSFSFIQSIIMSSKYSYEFFVCFN